nr:MAG TPA: hypothetical protein [Caudoviricetes sp.]
MNWNLHNVIDIMVKSIKHNKKSNSARKSYKLN